MLTLAGRALVAALTLATPLAASADAPKSAADLPVNQWVQLEATFAPGYTYSGTAFAPQRGQALHWGAVAHDRGVKSGANDVRAFDADKLAWVSDYESDPNQSWGIVGGGSGNAVSYAGVGKMLESGRPAGGMVVNAMTWDSKRKQVVISLPGLMAAYDPAARTWSKIEATTELHGHRLAGGPPVYGAGMCYDPVNDEIVMFPHFGAQQADMRPVTGRVSGHLGTLRFSYKDNTWRRVGDTLGTAEARGKQRQAAIAALAKLSAALDDVWPLHHAPDAGKPLAAAQKRIAAIGTDVGDAEASKALADAASADSPAATLAAGARACWRIEALLDGPLAVEPPRRSIAPMVYDAKNQVIVMFGGDDGRIRQDLRNTFDGQKLRDLYQATERRLNDTWAYDCRTRQWRNLSSANRPPARQAPMVGYDPDSGLVVLVTIDGNPWDTRIPRKVAVWTLDVAAGRWQKRTEHDWAGAIDRRGWYGFALDPTHKLLLVTHTAGAEQTTFAMRYDLATMPTEDAPAWQPPPAETPTVLPPDDPAWVAKLKELPANQWTPADPPVEPSRRDWGSIAQDPVRGTMVYFGGGHSTYQGTDVVVYQVGANRWVHQAGGHNDSLPPVGWGGYHMDLWGGNNAGHMRNQYVALDGRMFMNVGFGHQLKPRDGVLTTDVEIVSLPDAPHAWFYDIDRGGVWRQRSTKLDEGELPEPSRGRRPSRPLVVDPSGYVYDIHIETQRYDNTPRGVTFQAYNIYTGEAVIREVPQPWPNAWPESRPFCMLTGRGKIFLQDYNWKLDAQKKKGEPVEGPVSRTWVYDIEANKFIDLKPANQPPGRALGAAYLAGQDAVLAIFNDGGRDRQQWVYSLKRNRWAPLPVEAKGVSFQAPYCQMDFVQKYGVLVNYAGKTWVMRPDVSQVKWE